MRFAKTQRSIRWSIETT